MDLSSQQGGGQKLPGELTSRGYRWCRTCRIVRPPRASRGPCCENCVIRYVHHCPFVNNCVGQRNYHFFVCFVTSVLCLVILDLPVLFVFLNSGDFSAGSAEFQQRQLWRFARLLRADCVWFADRHRDDPFLRPVALPPLLDRHEAGDEGDPAVKPRRCGGADALCAARAAAL